MKNTFNGLISRLDGVWERIRKAGKYVNKLLKLKGKEQKSMKKMEQIIQEMWGSYKRCDICVMEMPEEEEEKKEKKNYLRQ